jgi:hypothetical protein
VTSKQITQVGLAGRTWDDIVPYSKEKALSVRGDDEDLMAKMHIVKGINTL